MAQYFLPAVIPAGESISNAVQASTRIAFIYTPDDWTAAPLSFQISLDGQKFFDLMHTQITVDQFVTYETVVPAITPGAAIALPPDTGGAISYIRLRSGTRQRPIVQTEARTFQLIFLTRCNREPKPHEKQFA